MVEVVIVDKIPDEQRRHLVYRGGLVVFRRLPAIATLCELAQTMAREALATADPQLAHRGSGRWQFAEAAGPLQLRYATDPRTCRLFVEGLRQAGVDPDHNCIDRSAMRIQPPGTSHLTEETIGLGPHRDVWYGCPLQQHNWWGPIFPIDAQSCLAFYPRYWGRAIENSSAAYVMEEFSKSRAEARSKGLTIEQIELRSHRPLPTEPLDDTTAVKLIMEPGDLVCFSSAQLHFGIPNTSTRTRFSTEIRTVHLGDIEQGIGASCVDSYGRGSSIDHFVSISGGRPISDLLSPDVIKNAIAQACPNTRGQLGDAVV